MLTTTIMVKKITWKIHTTDTYEMNAFDFPSIVQCTSPNMTPVGVDENKSTKDYGYYP